MSMPRSSSSRRRARMTCSGLGLGLGLGVASCPYHEARRLGGGREGITSLRESSPSPLVSIRLKACRAR
jgi:hypothetical protein